MFTTTFKNTVLNAVFGGDGGSALPTACMVGLSTTPPTAAGDNITEPDGESGYARLSVVFETADAGVIKNEATLEFPTFTADAGVATHYVLYDQDGTPFWFDALDRPRTLEAESVLAFPAQAVSISLLDVE